MTIDVEAVFSIILKKKQNITSLQKNNNIPTGTR